MEISFFLSLKATTNCWPYKNMYHCWLCAITNKKNYYNVIQNKTSMH